MDANAGKGVTWCFSSTLQLVHLSTGKFIGATILLSEWLSLYISTLAVDHCSERSWVGGGEIRYGDLAAHLRNICILHPVLRGQ